MQVRAKEYRTSFSHYSTQVCAIAGGMYVVAGTSLIEALTEP
jgi:hypothetical protein